MEIQVEVVCISEPDILLISLAGRKLDLIGQLKVTDYALSFIVAEEAYLYVPLGYILKCERIIEEKSTDIEIILKYGCSFRLKYLQNKWEASLKAQNIIATLVNKSVETPFRYGLQASNYCVTESQSFEESVLQEMNVKQIDNTGYAAYPSYPAKFFAPSSLSGKKPCEQRLIFLSFIYSGKQLAGCWRTGPGRVDLDEEKWILQRSKRAMSVLDIRSKTVVSKREGWRCVELESLASLKDSFAKIWQLNSANQESSRFLNMIFATKWHEQLLKLLDESYWMSQGLLNGRDMIILAEVEVRAAQISVLGQILLLPECRTFNGFSALLQRQILQFGFTKSAKKEKDQDKGAAIIQLLDAIYQLTCMYPLSFEFTSSYLMHIAQHIYSNKYGNFLFATRVIEESDRNKLSSCSSIWREAGPEQKGFINPFYVHFEQCDVYELQRPFSPFEIRIWTEFYGNIGKKKEDNIQSRHDSIRDLHFQHKQNVRKLRAMVAQQQKAIVAKKEEITLLM